MPCEHYFQKWACPAGVHRETPILWVRYRVSGSSECAPTGRAKAQGEVVHFPCRLYRVSSVSQELSTTQPPGRFQPTLHLEVHLVAETTWVPVAAQLAQLVHPCSP